MAHLINVLAGPCTMRNHFDCDHDAPRYSVSPYATLGMPVDTAQYLDGWSLVAGVAQSDHNDDEISMLILMLESEGCRSDFDRGVRDGVNAAFGTRAGN